MVKKYFITKSYDNELPIDFVYSKNKKWIYFQYCLAVCNEYIDAETECRGDFIQRDKYLDCLIWYVNLVPIDQNRKYEYIGIKRNFRVWFTDSKGNGLNLIDSRYS